MSDQQNGQQLVDMMEAVWRSIGELCQGFSEGQWKTATDCPNWSVQDQLSHLVGVLLRSMRLRRRGTSAMRSALGMRSRWTGDAHG